MIKIVLNNEILDIEDGSTVTFKKAQLLNGIQDQYSYSNNFNLKDSSKNRRLLKINYLPTSKAQSMTAGYDVDVVFAGCIFLKRQKLKVQKEPKGGLAAYLVFTDSYFMALSKSMTLNQIVTNAGYAKDLVSFLSRNLPFETDYRTAPVSAQDSSRLVVIEEVPILINLQKFIFKIFTQLGYSYTGDILSDTDIGKYYVSQNVGIYGPDGSIVFDSALTVYDFIIWSLKTFNGYLEISDSSRLLGLYFWKNIESIKRNFVDYSDMYTDFTEYVCDGGLAKINTMSYADSPDYFNGFFSNNKSLVDSKQYLQSDFGAGPLKLFGDQEAQEDGTLEPRIIGEVTDPQNINIFVFEGAPAPLTVYSGGSPQTVGVYRAVSPNILQIFNEFHRPYTNNIATPTTVQLNFRYNAIMVSEFKMFRVFFIRQLASYWIPIEFNFTSKKDGVKIKSLLIEKTAADVPIVFDYSMGVGFYGEAIINDINILYSALNVSPADTMTIVNADLTKNRIFINDIEVLAFPTAISVAAAFNVRIENSDTENRIDNSDILFQFASQDGGISRVAKLNIAHTGQANFVSEFRSEPGTVYEYGRTGVDYFYRKLNYSAKITTPINIADTLAPMIGDVETNAEAIASFKFFDFDRASTVKVDLSILKLELYCTNEGGGAEARTKIWFDIWKNGVKFLNVYYAGAIDSKKKSDTTVVYNNISVSKTFNVSAGDDIQVFASLEGTEESRPGSGHMGGRAKLTNVNWKFSVSEQL